MRWVAVVDEGRLMTSQAHRLVMRSLTPESLGKVATCERVLCRRIPQDRKWIMSALKVLEDLCGVDETDQLGEAWLSGGGALQAVLMALDPFSDAGSVADAMDDREAAAKARDDEVHKLWGALERLRRWGERRPGGRRPKEATMAIARLVELTTDKIAAMVQRGAGQNLVPVRLAKLPVNAG